jgi:hypothetical protein
LTKRSNKQQAQPAAGFLSIISKGTDKRKGMKRSRIKDFVCVQYIKQHFKQLPICKDNLYNFYVLIFGAIKAYIF